MYHKFMVHYVIAFFNPLPTVRHEAQKNRWNSSGTHSLAMIGFKC
ncbi:hypothetical protein KNP414_02184 [Paenibacillus mucilaginosus KNP414]|uniref:Uncharacterized protein n=1 Tax=Paenibacillus mucilaginosus (strain KNP414) TaxID=1036673 RepID=F8F515_PAEMK|nr:hypothetical protein KNP414_02184 [Paenibacillus mucilaginosus KNP414]